MTEFRFICARLILYERVLKILCVTERHTMACQLLNSFHLLGFSIGDAY